MTADLERQINKRAEDLATNWWEGDYDGVLDALENEHPRVAAFYAANIMLELSAEDEHAVSEFLDRMAGRIATAEQTE